LIQGLKGSDVTVWFVTASTDDAAQNFIKQNQLNVTVLNADVKVLKPLLVPTL
jgi:hypothetical protein